MCDTLECAICFEEISTCTALPCSCKINYCTRCWDRALAASFKSAGKSTCPSCRSRIRVDFDSDAADGRGALVFSKDNENASPCSDSSNDGYASTDPAWRLSVRDLREQEQVIERLAEQAKPVQKRILQQYGLAHSVLQDISNDPMYLLRYPVAQLREAVRALQGTTEGCVEKSDLVSRLVEIAGSSQALASYWASATEDVARPECVCHGSLARVSGRERTCQFVESMFPDLAREAPEFEQIVAVYVERGQAGVICDLCDENVDGKRAIWTCSNGQNTILHATSYDVCDACFSVHVLPAG